MSNLNVPEKTLKALKENKTSLSDMSEQSVLTFFPPVLPKNTHARVSVRIYSQSNTRLDDDAWWKYGYTETPEAYYQSRLRMYRGEGDGFALDNEYPSVDDIVPAEFHDGGQSYGTYRDGHLYTYHDEFSSSSNGDLTSR